MEGFIDVSSFLNSEVWQYFLKNNATEKAKCKKCSAILSAKGACTSLYEISKIRPVNLDKIYNALLTIKPTSVEPERAFSSMGYFVTKLRSLLDDDNVDALIFLRQYYNCNK